MDVNPIDQQLFARQAHHVDTTLGIVQQWEHRHPDVIDYRVVNAQEHLKAALKLLQLLARNELPPEWHAAMAALRALHSGENPDA
jgi:hypothetical protein